MAEQPAEQAPQELSFQSHNDSKEETIILLHGLLSCHHEWQHVIPFLGSYHVLIPDLNGHSGSSAIHPTTIPSCAANVAHLIRAHAKNSKAHVVGLSFGGFVALKLGEMHPELVSSLFVTGASPIPDAGVTSWMIRHPWTIYYTMSLMVRWTPAWLYWAAASSRNLVRHDDLYAEMQRNLIWENVSECYTSIAQDVTSEGVKGIKARTLAIVATRDEDPVPVADMLGLLPEGSRGVRVDAVHAWDLQRPELFARGVLAWVGGEELPEGFEPLVPSS